jgi:hypothetical protein
MAACKNIAGYAVDMARASMRTSATANIPRDMVMDNTLEVAGMGYMPEAHAAHIVANLAWIKAKTSRVIGAKGGSLHTSCERYASTIGLLACPGLKQRTCNVAHKLFISSDAKY